MIDQFMIRYFEESSTTDFYRNSLDNLRASLVMNTLMESQNDYYSEASHNFKEAIKEFFEKLIQSIKDLVKKIKEYIHEKIQNIQMNKKLGELKKLMLANRTKLSGKKVTILDTTKYMVAYRKYIDLINIEFKKLTSRKYENSDAFQKEAMRVNNLIDSAAEKLGLTNDEKYAIETDVFNALSVAEKSIKLYDNEFNVSAKEWESSIRTNGKTAEMEENPTIADRIKVLSHKFSNTCSKCFQFMSKHPIASISIIAAAVASIIGISAAIGSGHGNDKYHHSDTLHNNSNKIDNAIHKLTELKNIEREIDSSNEDLRKAIDHNMHQATLNTHHAADIAQGLKKAVDAGILDDSSLKYGEDIANIIWSDKDYDNLTKSIKWDAPINPSPLDNRLRDININSIWGTGRANVR